MAPVVEDGGRETSPVPEAQKKRDWGEKLGLVREGRFDADA